MEENQVLKKAIIKLYLSNPFFASILLRMKIVEDNTQPTACTDGKQIWYNQKFVSELNQLELIGLLAHEIAHIFLMHHLRRGNRDIRTWNCACDYAVNEILTKDGFTLPEGALLKKDYFGLAAERIFDIINSQDQQDNEGNGDADSDGDEEEDENTGGNGESKSKKEDGNEDRDGSECDEKCSKSNGKSGSKFNNKKNSNFGEVRDAPYNNESERKEMEQQTKELIISALQQSKMCGKEPAFSKLIYAEIYPKEDWRTILRSFITEVTRNDFSFKKPNEKYMHTGFYLPSLYKEEIGNIILAVDTSGSINKELLSIFIAEIRSILEETAGTDIKAICCDSSVKGGLQDITDNELKIMGGGGTDYIPVFYLIEKEDEQPKAVLYFTDGYCNSFPSHEPDYPVLWCVYNNDDFQPKFGYVIYF